jgi:hypothetical protein
MSVANYLPGIGVILTIRGTYEGLSIIIRDDMTVSAMENSIKEVIDWLE